MVNSATSKRQKTKRIPVLIIEDNADHWLLIRSALLQSSPEVEPIWVNNAAQALAYLESCSPDESRLPRLILMDLFLPRREDGWGLLKAIKDNEFYRQPPLVMLSSSQDRDDVRRAYTFNVASYIVKPATFHQWLTCFTSFRHYWLETVVLPAQS